MRTISFGFVLGLFASVAATISSGAEPGPRGRNSGEKGTVFKQLDKDGNGILQSDEIDAAQQKAFTRLLRVGDKNRDGQLTREEYQTALAPEEPADSLPGDDAGPKRGRGGFDAERLFRRADKDGDGKLTLEELPEKLQQRLRPVYERLGRDALTKEDFKNLKQRFGGGRPQAAGDGKAFRPGNGRKPGEKAGGKSGEKNGRRPAADARGADAMGTDGPARIVRLLDSDHDGRLSRDELAELSNKFDQFDKDGNGQLDAGEIAHVFGNARGPQRFEAMRDAPRRGGPAQTRKKGDGPGKGRNPQAIFDRFDADQDGFISKDEAPERMQQHFDRIDRDGDGKASPDELKQAMARRRAGGRPQPKTD